MLEVEGFDEKNNKIQVDSKKMVIKPPSGRINNYLKMINDLKNRKEWK